MSEDTQQPLIVTADPATGQVSSVQLYGAELLRQDKPSHAEVIVNGRPLKTRLYPTLGADPNDTAYVRMKGEQFTDHFSGWGLVVARMMGARPNAEYPCWGVQYHLRREQADMTDLPCPGPGGPVIEAPLFVDTFTLMNWNWDFWGDDTRMVFSSLHSTGPTDEWGHAGYENDTPEKAKAFMQNVWRRIYPGVMVIHGGLFYNAKTGHWVAITCRRPNVGYILNIEDAGRGVGFDFTLHAPFSLGQSLQMPEVKIYYGQTADEMWKWAAEYVTLYYEEPPAWFHKTVWGPGLAWNNEPTWTAQADAWEKQLDASVTNGIGYSLVTNRPAKSGTDPLGYEPDPNHGSIAEFRAMGRRIADRGIPFLTWMSHSGLMPGGVDIDDDWFIRGIDGRVCAAWGTEDHPALAHINPGHPGYIEYTKKWIRFYMKECGAKGIFFDCLGWAFPPDYTPRSFMRFPGDTNRMAVKFMEEIYACIKECDPDGIMLGEGTTLEGPVNVFSIHSNPVRAIDGMGPRDHFLFLNRYARKRMIIDQAPTFNPACGMVQLDPRPGAEARNKALADLIARHGSRDAFTAVPGDLSILAAEKLLIVPVPYTGDDSPQPPFRLPEPWDKFDELTDTVTGAVYSRAPGGMFEGVTTGIYRMSPSASQTRHLP